jgi:hypothetical protein
MPNRGTLPVLSELKQHLGTMVMFLLCSSYNSKKRAERGVLADKLSPLYCHRHQKAREENQTWLHNVLLPSLSLYL